MPCWVTNRLRRLSSWYSQRELQSTQCQCSHSRAMDHYMRYSKLRNCIEPFARISNLYVSSLISTTLVFHVYNHKSELYVGGSMTVWMVTSLLSWIWPNKKICCYTESNPVKLETIHTDVLPPTDSVLWSESLL